MACFGAVFTAARAPGPGPGQPGVRSGRGQRPCRGRRPGPGLGARGPVRSAPASSPYRPAAATASRASAGRRQRRTAERARRPTRRALLGRCDRACTRPSRVRFERRVEDWRRLSPRAVLFFSPGQLFVIERARPARWPTLAVAVALPADRPADRGRGCWSWRGPAGHRRGRPRPVRRRWVCGALELVLPPARRWRSRPAPRQPGWARRRELPVSLQRRLVEPGLRRSSPCRSTAWTTCELSLTCIHAGA